MRHSTPSLPTLSRAQARLGLSATFITALLAAQVTATKLVTIPLGFNLPGIGTSLLVPAAAFAYALTFFASDCYAELFGKKAATDLIRTAFFANILLLVLIALAVRLPQGGGVPQAQFATVLGASTNIVVASLTAYLISQHLDVSIFHALADWTDGQHLWMRNIGSTALSQFIDTLVFILAAFAVYPALSNTGAALPATVLVKLVLGQYLLKITLALSDTPVVYGIRALVSDSTRNQRDSALPSD